MEIFERLAQEWHHHDRDRIPLEGAPMPKLSELKNIAGDLQTTVSSADQWLAKIVQEHVPQLLAIAEKYESSPIIQALESAVLPPEVEAQVAAIIATLAKQYPATAVAEVAVAELEAPPA